MRAVRERARDEHGHEHDKRRKVVGVRRFIFILVIYSEIGNLLNHEVKLAVETYLLNSRVDRLCSARSTIC